MNRIENLICGWLRAATGHSTSDCMAEEHLLRIETLPPDFASGGGKAQESVAEELLLRLHQSVKGKPEVEERIWDQLIPHLSHPLPTSIAVDLIQRRVSIPTLVQNLQTTDVSIDLEEALTHLACDLYGNPQYSAHEFSTLLSQFPAHKHLFDRLSYQIPSCPEKKTAFVEIASSHPDWPKLKGLVEGLEEVLKRWEQERVELNHRIERSRLTNDTQEIYSLHETKNPQVLLRLARNPHTPDEILLSLVQVRRVEGAPRIRGEAKSALKRRGKPYCDNRQRPRRANSEAVGGS